MRKLPLMLVITLSLFVLPMLIHSASASFMFPKGSYDFGFNSGNIRYIGGTEQFCDADTYACGRVFNANGGTFQLQSSGSFQNGFSSGYLQMIPSGSSGSIYFDVPIPSNARYVHICMKTSVTSSGGYSEVSIYGNNLATTTMRQFSSSEDACELYDLDSYGYSGQSESYVRISAYNNNGGVEVDLYSVQFLDSDYNTVNPIDTVDKVYYSDSTSSAPAFNRYGGTYTGSATYQNEYDGNNLWVCPADVDDTYKYTVVSFDTNQTSSFNAYVKSSTLYSQTSSWWNENTSLPTYWYMYSYIISQQSSGPMSPEIWFRHLASDGITYDYTTSIKYSPYLPGVIVTLYDSGMNVVRQQQFTFSSGISYTSMTMSIYKPSDSGNSYIVLIPSPGSGGTSCSDITQNIYYDSYPIQVNSNDYMVNSNTPVFYVGDLPATSYTIGLTGVKYRYTEEQNVSYTSISNVQLTSSATSVNVGDSVLLSASWSGGTAPYGVKIYEQNSDYYGDSDWHLINDVRSDNDGYSNTLTDYIITPHLGTNVYKVEVYDENSVSSPTSSNTVTVTAQVADISNVQLSASSTSLHQDQDLTLSGSWSGGKATYHVTLYVQNSDYYGDSNWHILYTTNTSSASFSYTYTPNFGTNQYYFEVTDDYGHDKTSNQVTVTDSYVPITNVQLTSNVSTTLVGHGIHLGLSWDGASNSYSVEIYAMNSEYYGDSNWHLLDEFTAFSTSVGYDTSAYHGTTQYKFVVYDQYSTNDKKTSNIVNVTAYKPGPHNVNLVFDKTNVSTSEDVGFTVSWSDGEPDFNVTLHVSGHPDIVALNVSGSPYNADLVFGSPAGQYDVYATVTDSLGRSYDSNHITINVYQEGNPINNYHTKINDIEGIPYGTINITVNYGDTLHVDIYNISGGYPPYTIKLINNVNGFTLYNITTSSTSASFDLNVTPEDFPCINSVNISSTERLCQNPLFTVVSDTHGQTNQQGPHIINVKTKIPGTELTANISVTPNTELTTKTKTYVDLHISGGRPPYHVTIYDSLFSTLCDYVTDKTDYRLIVYFTSGEHIGNGGVFADVISADGQDTVTNKVSFNVTPYYPYECSLDDNYYKMPNCEVFNRVKDYVIGCLGNISGWATNNETESEWGTKPTGAPTTYQNVTIQTTLHYPSFVNVTAFKEAGYEWVLPFLSLEFWITLAGLALSAFLTKIANGDGKVFGISMLVWIVIFGIAGIYPGWIVLVLALGIGLLIFYIWQKGG